MSERAARPGSVELPVPETVDEAMLLWRLCTRLADRIWERHESEFIERLIAEERGRRCDDHPWERVPCASCGDEHESHESNLAFVFGGEQDAHR